MKTPKLSRRALDDPLESYIENKVCTYAVKTYGIAHRKFKTPNHRSSPDRIFYWTEGRATFIEFKRKGREPTDNQKREIQRLRDRGFPVEVVDTIALGRVVIDQMAQTFDIPPLIDREQDWLS